MNVKILTFGIARDITGSSLLQLEVPHNTSVADLQTVLRSNYPGLQRLSKFLIAVNANYVNEETILKENDEVAIIPPVSGG